eukprot:1157627-Pelagomonas_calceolata.AAC.13
MHAACGPRRLFFSLWPTDDQTEHDELPNKLAKYQNWVALPFRHIPAFGKPLQIPRYLHLDLGRHMQRNIACFRLHAHKLRVETSLWQGHSPLCLDTGPQCFRSAVLVSGFSHVT